MEIEETKIQLEKLLEVLSVEKREKIAGVLRNRTRYVTLVLEDMYHSLNASATLRTAECFGVQDVYVVENNAKFQVQQGISKGANMWLDIYRHTDIVDCCNHVKERGYRLIATTPHHDAILLPQLPLDKPCALIFGTEDRGLSSQALELADMCVKIPMYGFTQSFNVSASVALCLYQVRMTLEQSTLDWRLSEQEYNELHYTFVKRILTR